MKIVFKIPYDPAFPSEPGWNMLGGKMDTKRLLLNQLILIPFGILVIFIYDVFIYMFFQKNVDWTITSFVSLSVVTIVLHELIHALMLPGGIGSSRTYLGVSAKHLVFFVYYDGVLTRNRLIAVTLAPFVTLSVVPVAVASFLHAVSDVRFLDHPGFDVVFKIVSLNAAFSLYDLYSAVYLLKYLRKNTCLRSNGLQTYWRPV